MWHRHLGGILTVKHKAYLDLPAKLPINSVTYYVGPKVGNIERSKILKVIVLIVIGPAITEGATPVVFAPKKDETLRFCIDYWKVDAVTISDSYLLPTMDDYTGFLREAQIFYALDATSVFWQSEVNPFDREKSAFTSHQRL